MTPKEKAKELVDSMYIWQSIEQQLKYPSLHREYAKQCALIAVDEIMKVIYYEGKSEYIYWKEVCNEIEKL